jgi:Calx-beta domain/IPT/TIG domain
MSAPTRPFHRRRTHNQRAFRIAGPRISELLEDRVLPSLLGQQLFPSNNPWNQQITSAPVASNSTAIINNIVSLYGDGKLHPDFGQDTQTNNPLYGIPYNIVHGNTQQRVHVVIDEYADESDLQDAPIPANAVIEGDNQNGPVVGLANRGDSHLIVYDVDNNVAYEFYQASRPSENSDGNWHAAQESVWDMKTNTFRTLGWTSADAAGLAILPGLVRPDEALPVSDGGQGVINHAIRFTLKNNIILDQYLFPASHVANSNTNASIDPPMGARFRLKSSVDISQLNPESKIIAQAMKDYGMIVADNGSNFFFTGASYSVDANNGFSLTWNDNDIQDSTHGLKSLPFDDFEVVDLTPKVTGLSQTSGPAGSTVTIVGQNFSGAAGHLQVQFGSTLATGVTVIDDAHVQAVVPSGTGTVDVRVQSGVSGPANSQNVENTIFGYGISAVSSSDKFTYQQSTSPSVSINSVSLVEGNSGSKNATFTVTLSAANSQTVSVPFSTANGTATAGTDYTATTGTVTFAPGTVSQPINVPVSGDTVAEPDETFTVKLGTPTNAVLGNATGTGTILNDDTKISINDVSHAEGNRGTTTFTFTVSLSAAATFPVTVKYATANGTATAPSDYTALALTTLTFKAGTTSKTVKVSVIGDKTVEPNETFFVNLSSPTSAAIADSQGVGTIVNDDGNVHAAIKTGFASRSHLKMGPRRSSSGVHSARGHSTSTQSGPLKLSRTLITPDFDSIAEQLAAMIQVQGGTTSLLGRRKVWI